ncbi:MAG: hypothetical protein KDA96_20145, partial [Planctomycetaceae bacterium]|nr:hypothetical protein [Planctomycetaceae bacterium]
LHQHGIQLVIADERIRLSDLPFGSDVQLLTQNNCLNIQFQATGELRLAMCRRGDWSVGRTLSLLVDQTDPAAAHRSSSGGESSACDDRASGAGDLASEIRFAETRRSLTYIAAPAIRADQERRQVSVNGVLRTTAGAPQAVHPAESGAFGAMFVEADSSAFTIQTEFVPLDCIRFEQQEIRSELVISAAQLDALLKDSCTRLTVPPDRTLVVDWTIHAPLEVAGADVEEADVDERHLLAGLRRFLQVGHSGIWPRRIRYADDSRVVSANRADAAVTEFLKVAAERTRGAVRGSSWLGAPLGSGLGTAAGLDFLERAA